MWTTTTTHHKTGVETSQLKITSTPGDKHQDGINMGRNQSIMAQSGEQIKPHKKLV
jgi:hypothetical protein